MEPQTLMGGGFMFIGFWLVGFFLSLHWSEPKTASFTHLVRGLVFAVGGLSIVMGRAYAGT